MVVAIALLSAVVGYLYTSSKPPVYEAATQVELRNPYDMTLFRQEGTPFTEINRYLAAQAEMVTSPEVMAKASALLQGELRAPQVRQSVAAQSSTTLFEVHIRVRMLDPAQAARTLNAVTRAYKAVADAQVRRETEAYVGDLLKLQAYYQSQLDALPSAAEDPSVEAHRDTLSTQVGEVQSKIGRMRTDAAAFGGGISRIDQARVPEVPISDTPRRRAVIFGLLGLIAGLVVAFWRAERVRVIDTSDDAVGAVNAPLLGVLPQHRVDPRAAAAPVLSAPQSAAARDYEFIASTLALTARESETRLILVTSPQAGPAKSVTALNLALSAAQDQRRVILLDADPSGVTTGLLGAESYRGVSDLVALSAAGFGFALQDGSMTPIEGLPSFCVVPTGTREANGRSTAESPQMPKVLAHLQQEADLLFVDGPPLRVSPGGMKLAASVDGVILVVPRGTTVEELRQTQAMLAMAKAAMVGFVFDRSRRLGPRRWWKRRPSEPERGRRRAS
jgi:Mrp family chromosome partitioning ATPase